MRSTPIPMLTKSTTYPETRRSNKLPAPPPTTRESATVSNGNNERERTRYTTIATNTTATITPNTTNRTASGKPEPMLKKAPVFSAYSNRIASPQNDTGGDSSKRYWANILLALSNSTVVASKISGNHRLRCTREDGTCSDSSGWFCTTSITLHLLYRNAPDFPLSHVLLLWESNAVFLK